MSHKTDPTAELFKSLSGYEDTEAEIIGTMATLFRDLMLQNWPTIRDIRQRSEESSVAISFGFDVDASGVLPLVKAKISFSEKWKDEAEAFINDPKQEKLNLNN